METELDFFRYNTSKKLAQLNKVIVYLSYVNAERLSQIDSIKKNYKEQENKIFDTINETVTEYLNGISDDKTELEKSVKILYENKISTMKAALTEKMKQTENEIKKKNNEIQTLANSLAKMIKNINQKLDEQFKFLNDKSKCDVSAIRIQVIKLDKDYQVALKKQNIEINKKIKEAEDELSKKEEILKEKFQKDVTTLKNDAKIPKMEIEANVSKELKRQKDRVKFMKNKLLTNKTTLLQDKEFFLKTITEYARKVRKVLIEQLSSEQKMTDTDIENMNKALKQNVENIKKEIAELKKRKESLASDNAKRLTSAKNELNDIKNQAKVGLENKEKEMNESIKNKENEIKRAIIHQDNKIQLIKAQYKDLKQKYLDMFQSLEDQINNFDSFSNDEIAKVKRELEASKKSYFQEVEKYKDKLAKHTQIETKNYDDIKAKVENQVNDFNEHQKIIIKNDIEYKKLKAIKDTLIKTHSVNIQQLMKDQEKEIELIKQQNSEEFSNSNEKLETNYAFAKEKYEIQKKSLEQRLILKSEEKENELNKISLEFLESYQKECESESKSLLSNTEEELKNEFQSLNTELETILVPEKNSFDNIYQEIQDLSNQSQQLPDEISREKDNIIRNFNHLIESEEDRHRESLFSHLTLSKKDNSVDIENIQKEGREKLEKLDHDIEIMQNELKELKDLAAKYYMFNDSTDLEKIKLEEELSNLRQEMKEKIREAEKAKDETIQNLNDQIKEQINENKRLVKEEKDQQLLEISQNRKEYENQRIKRKTSASFHERNLVKARVSFVEEIDKIKANHSDNMASMQQRIVDFRDKCRRDEKEDQDKLQNDKQKKEQDAELFSKEMPEKLKSLHDGIDKMFPYLDKKIQETTKYRDKKKEEALNRPMRQEEISVIERLEDQLDFVTQELTVVGKDLLLYRKQLILQECEYNSRFGVDPSVAVMKPNSKKRAHTTLIAKRLPRLSGFNIHNNI